eukprot:TRINITY_DN2838_c0_g1_i1.p1 TRINITY_DN2838_c0_g1~~TRINITY_DN2838_c0_g1_i1.p1  ORF type:complete len:1678 (-),score=286.87 TRINITY_DN2838_c0_g1_i1:25-4380(-)
MKFFELIKWENATSRQQILAVMNVIGAQRYISDVWVNKFFDEISSSIFQPPFDYAFMFGLATWQKYSSSSKVNRNFFQFVQLLAASGLVMDCYENNKSTTTNSGHDIRWFISDGYVKKIVSLYQENQSDIYTNVLIKHFYHILCAIKYEPVREITQTLGRIVGGYFLKAPSKETPIHVQNYIHVSFKDTENVPLWESLWTRILIPNLRNEKFGPLINLLFHGLLCWNSDYEQISSMIRNERKYRKRDMIGMMNKNTWIGYAAAYSYQPQLPSPSSVEPGSDYKESGLWVWKECAMKLKNYVMAVPFWERFFRLYFLVQYEQYFPKQWRDDLNKHFQSVGEKMEELKDVSRVYYSFTTWSSEVIFPDNAGLFEVYEGSVLNTFMEMAPPFSYIELNIARIPDVFNVNVPPFVDFKTIDTHSDILNLLHERKEIPSDVKIHEDICFSLYQLELERNVRAIQSILEGNTRSIPAIDEISFQLQQYVEIGNRLVTKDNDFLNLVRGQYYNHKNSTSISVRCRSMDCRKPATIPMDEYTIAPIHPTIMDDMQTNRSQYNDEYLIFFDIARSLAHTTSIIVDLKNYILSENYEELGIDFFFKLSKIAFDGTFLPNSPMIKILTGVLEELGTKFLVGRANDNQLKLLDIILSYTPQDNKIKDTKVDYNEASTIIPLFKIFTPFVYLENQNSAMYIRMLDILSKANSNLNETEMSALLDRFNTRQAVPMLIDDQNGREIMFSILENSLSKPGMKNLTSLLCQLLIRMDYSRTLELILRAKNIPTLDWNTLLGDWSYFSNEESYEILKMVEQSLPVSENVFNGMVLIIQKLTLETPLKGTLEESPEEIWKIVRSIYRSLLASYTYKFEELLEFLAKIVRVCPNLINYMWYIYVESVIPFINSNPNDDIIASIIRILGNLPWKQATFHYTDPTSLQQLSRHIDIVPQITRFLFNELNWESYVDNIRNGETELYENNTAHFLYLFVAINMISPSAIPVSLRTLILGISNDENWYENENYLFDWRQMPPMDFITVFHGHKFIALLTSGIIHSDPSQTLLESLVLLRDIVRLVGHPDCIAVFLDEVHTILHTCLKDFYQESYWVVTPEDKITIISSIILPLVKQHVETVVADEIVFENFEIGNRPLINLIKLAKNGIVGNRRLLECNLLFGNRENFVDAPSNGNNVILVLIQKFFQSATIEVALHTFHCAYAARDTQIVMEILDVALHAFLTNGRNISECVDELQLTVDIETLPQYKTPLIFRACLDKSMRDPENDWVKLVLHTLKPILSFVPLENREIDIFALWFFVLEVVQDKRFVLNSVSKKALEQFRNLMNIYNLNFVQRSFKIDNYVYIPDLDNVAIELGIRACNVYLTRILVSKNTNTPISTDPAQLYDKLMALKNNPKYAKYDDYFYELTDLLSPTLTLAYFENTLIETLVPYAPYLKGICIKEDEDSLSNDNPFGF